LSCGGGNHEFWTAAADLVETCVWALQLVLLDKLAYLD
jgi:hypothetical protein